MVHCLFLLHFTFHGRRTSIAAASPSGPDTRCINLPRVDLGGLLSQVKGYTVFAYASHRCVGQFRPGTGCRGYTSPWPDDPLHPTLYPKQETSVVYRYTEHAFVCTPIHGVAHVDRSQVSTPYVYLALLCRPSSHSATKAGLARIWESASLLYFRLSCQHLQSAYSSHPMDITWSRLRFQECV